MSKKFAKIVLSTTRGGFNRDIGFTPQIFNCTGHSGRARQDMTTPKFPVL